MMKAYPKYKDSGVPWLEHVPVHWEIFSLGAVLKERKELNKEYNIDLVLSVTKDRGVILYTEKGNIGNKASEDISRYKIVKYDDIVLNSMNVIIGSVGISNYIGCLSPVYYVLTSRDTNLYEPKYLNAYFQVKPFQRSLVRIGNGILAHRMRIPMEKLKREPFPVPPHSEQLQILRYLDWKTSKINNFIKSKKKLITLLKEQKQNIINEAVIKGINPDIKMVDSGIEWIGKIPEHWGMRRLTSVILGIEQGWSPTAAEGALAEDQWAVLSLSAIRVGFFNKIAIKPIPTNANIPSKLELKNGDLLLTRANTRQKVGDCCIVDNVRPKTIFSDLIYRISINELICPKFIMMMLLSSIGRYQIETSARGSSGTMPKISHIHIKNIRFPLPPINEQQPIVDQIEKETVLIDKTIARTVREIELIQEYHTRLVSDVVTGKVDLRTIDIPDFEPIEAELKVKDDEIFEDDELIAEGIEE